YWLPRRAFHLFSTAPPTPRIYTLSLHDALPISSWHSEARLFQHPNDIRASLQKTLALLCLDEPRDALAHFGVVGGAILAGSLARSEEHTSELQSRSDLVCRLLLEKKKTRRLQYR